MRRLSTVAALSMLAGAAPAAHADDITFTLTQLAPAGGNGIAPLWVGLHDASFTTFTVGGVASAGLMQAAEDGSAAGLTSEFQNTAASVGGVQGTLPGPPAFSGDVRTLTLHGVDLNGVNRYLSYAAMVVLSNDFFLGNAAPVDLSTLAGGGTTTLMLGGDGKVYDAGTEINDFNFSVANGAYGIGGGQSAAGQGNAEGGVIHLASGDPYASFLGQDQVPNGFDWTPLQFNSQAALARLEISVTAVPEPASWAMLAGGLVAAMGWAARRQRSAAGTA